MLWFRHKNNAHNDPFIVDLMVKFKLDGYGVWFILLEILAAEDAFTKSAVISEEYMCRSMFLTFFKIKTVLDYCKQRGKLRVEYLKGKVSVFCPNLKKYRDEYTKKKQRKNVRTLSGQGTDNSRTMSVTEQIQIQSRNRTDTETEQKGKSPLLFNGFSYFKDAYATSKTTAYKTQDPDKDKRLCENLIKVFGQPAFCRAVQWYFRSNDAYITGRGYDVIAFNSTFKGFLHEEPQKTGSISITAALEKQKQAQLERDKKIREKNAKPA